MEEDAKWLLPEEERFLSHGMRELPSTPPKKLLPPPSVICDEEPELGKEDELYEARGLGWYDEQGLGEADPPIGSARSAARGLHP